jgi:hypothetical protein
MKKRNTRKRSGAKSTIRMTSMMASSVQPIAITGWQAKDANPRKMTEMENG